MYYITLTYGAHSGYGANRPDLSEALSHAARMRAFYDGSDSSSECTYDNVRAAVYVSCEKCRGDGQTVRRFKFAPARVKVCPVCRGDGMFPVPAVV